MLSKRVRLSVFIGVIIMIVSAMVLTTYVVAAGSSMPIKYNAEARAKAKAYYAALVWCNDSTNNIDDLSIYFALHGKWGAGDGDGETDTGVNFEDDFLSKIRGTEREVDCSVGNLISEAFDYFASISGSKPWSQWTLDEKKDLFCGTGGNGSGFFIAGYDTVGTNDYNRDCRADVDFVASQNSNSSTVANYAFVRTDPVSKGRNYLANYINSKIFNNEFRINAPYKDDEKYYVYRALISGYCSEGRGGDTINPNSSDYIATMSFELNNNALIMQKQWWEVAHPYANAKWIAINGDGESKQNDKDCDDDLNTAINGLTNPVRAAEGTLVDYLAEDCIQNYLTFYQEQSNYRYHVLTEEQIAGDKADYVAWFDSLPLIPNIDSCRRAGICVENTWPNNPVFECKVEEYIRELLSTNPDPDSPGYAGYVIDTLPGDGEDGGNVQVDPCHNSSESLGWILCPILDKVSEALDGLYTNAVEPFLVVNPELVSSNSGTYNAWQVMIGIANILVVIFLLVVIFSQLTGIGIDNYGIKKVLPKIIAAAILVNLSYIICQLAVDLSNILGNSLNSFLSNIEVSGLNSSLSLDGVSTEIQVSSDNAAWFKGLFTVAGGGLVGVGIAALAMSVVNSGWFAGLVLPILLFFVVALAAVLFFFILLGVRKAGVVILVVLAPLAFVCYMLPNTKKWFDKWLKAFEGLLLLYPICGLLIGGGQLVSKILLTVSDDYIMYFTGCIVLVVPFFFIPTLLKGSFAAMGNIGAKISGFGKALGARGRGRLDGAVRGSNWFKSHQAEIARQNQERTASRTVRRLNAKRDRNGGELNARDTRRLARSQESLDKLQREDRAARTVLSESEFANRTMPELQTAWEEAFDSGDTERLDALTNVLTMKYGSGGAKFIGDALSRKRVVIGVDASGRQTVNQNYVRSLRALQDNMNHNSNFAGNMKNKASDAYAMISNAGMYHNDATGQNEYRDLSHFSANNNISTDLKDWSTQSASTLQRAIDSGALSDEMVEGLLNSTDPSIQSGIQSDAGKRDVLQARMYNMTHNPSGVGPSLPADMAAQRYRAEQARTQNDNELFISHERDAERIGKTTITVSPGSVITGAPAVTFEGYAVPAGFNTGGSAPVRNADGHWIYKDSSTNREWNATTGRYMPPSTP